MLSHTLERVRRHHFLCDDGRCGSRSHTDGPERTRREPSVSARVVNRPTELDLVSDRSLWTVVIACYTDSGVRGQAPDPRPNPRIALGLVPTAAVTPRVVEQARRKTYDPLLLECPGTAATFRLPSPEPLFTHTSGPS